MQITHLVCPLCEAEAPEDQWKETEVACEDCGTHPALICPACHEDIDTALNSIQQRFYEMHDRIVAPIAGDQEKKKP